MAADFQTSTAHTFLVALRDGLAVRDDLAGVQIFSAPPGERLEPGEGIWFGDVEMDQSWGLIGNLARDEEFTIRGTVWVERPGNDEGTVDETRARAFALLSGIEDFLRAKVRTDRTFKGAEFKRARLQQGYNENGRVARLDFDVTVDNRLERT